MKILITLAVIALLIIAAILYFGSGDLDIAPKKTDAASGVAAGSVSSRDFSTLATLLQKDMASIPLSLDAPRAEPVNAFSVKARLGTASGARQEYQTLAQVCDLIIYADQDHSVRQLKDRQAQQEVFTDLMTSANAQQSVASTRRAAIHAQSQAEWAGYRQQTDAEVKRLLATLPNARR